MRCKTVRPAPQGGSERKACICYSAMLAHNPWTAAVRGLRKLGQSGALLAMSLLLAGSGFVAGFVSRLLIWLPADRKRARREEMLRVFLLLRKCLGMRCDTAHCRACAARCSACSAETPGKIRSPRHLVTWQLFVGARTILPDFADNVYEFPKRFKRELCLAPASLYSYINLDPSNIVRIRSRVYRKANVVILG